MRIHTNLTYRQMVEIVQVSDAPIYTEVLRQHGSRTHERAFEVMLSGSSTTRSQNGGEFFTATWDEWGAFLGALYDADPKARCGGSAERPVYRDADHYRFATGGRFQVRWDTAERSHYVPLDTHPRHHWQYAPAGFWCSKCSATRPTWEQMDAYAPRSYA